MTTTFLPALGGALIKLASPEAVAHQREELGYSDEEQRIAQTIIQRLHPQWREQMGDIALDLLQEKPGSGALDEDARSNLASYFGSLADSDLSTQSLVPQLEAWVAAARAGMTSRDYLLASHRYLALIEAEVRRSIPEKLADAQRVFGKLAFLHAGLVTEAIGAYQQHATTHRALHDDETGLPNHALFMEELRRAMAVCSEKNETLALLTLDLHYFNPQAPIAGNADVRPFALAAEHLRGALRENDMLARLSSKEFGFMLPGLASEGHAILAANKFLRTLENQLNLGEISAHIRPRIGIALFPEHARHAESLVQFATVARREAETSDSGYAIYSAEFDKNATLKRSLEAGLKTALRENELMLYFQPQCDATSGATIGAEALLRWRNSSNQMVPPNLIVEVAEQTGLISQLTMWVINSALRIRAGFMKSGIDLIVSVNLSAANLLDQELPSFVEQALRTWGVPPESLMLEITESAMITDAKTSLEILHRLKALGVGLSVDDFGTGYSSMAYLKQMPLDELKIDQTFVRKLTSVMDDQRIVRSMIDLAHNFELNVVAEGVEDKPTMDMLQTMGCDVIQGYYLAKPMPEEDFLNWCRQRVETLQAINDAESVAAE
jgi:diguanylate cyclase